MGVFNKRFYCERFRYVHEVHFDVKPDDTIVRRLIHQYFGGDKMCYYTDFQSLNGNPFHQWKFELSGKPDSTVHETRYIEAVLDRDTWCGERSEPFYFIVLNEDGDDAITLAIAEGLARFVAREMNGKLVSKNT